MRFNCSKAFAAWRQGRANHAARAIWTDGFAIYSYGTTLVTRSPDGRIILNRTRYSVTTTIHQNALACAFGNALEVDGLRRGATEEDLRNAAALLPKPKPFDVTGAIISYECGDLSEDATLELFQHLIDTGMAWTLQGHYGRTARALIDAGHCHARVA